MPASLSGSVFHLDSPLHVVLATIAGTLAYVICTAIYNVWFHPLRSFPGPPLAAASSVWIKRNNWYYRGAYELQAAHERYGPVVRVAPNTLSFADPGVLKTIFSHGPTFVKSDFYQARKAYQDDHLFSFRDQAAHAARRRLASRAFSMQSLLSFEPILNHKVATLVNSWATRIKPDEPLDVFFWCHYLGFEVMRPSHYLFVAGQELIAPTVQLAFDEDAGILATGQPDPVVEWMRHWKPVTVYRQILGDWPNHYGYLIPGPMGDHFRKLRNWKKWSLAAINRARKADTETVYLSKIMREKDVHTGQPLDDNALAEEAMGLMFGGSGTTGNTLVTLLWAVCSNPHIRTRLETEVRACEAPADGGVLAYSVTSHLPYLTAVINETLRRYPGIIGSQQRITTTATQILNVDVPKDTICLTANWVTHRSDYFPDPDRFDPDRWLDEKAERLKESFNPFGVGPRACLGTNLAMLELYQAAAAFFRRFDATVDPSMTEEMMVQNDTFNGQPRGATLLLHLVDREAIQS